MQKQYIDLPINLEDTPHHLLEKVQPFVLPADPEDCADQLLVKLEEAIKKQNQVDLYILSTAYFHQVDTQKFGINSGLDWPLPAKLEDKLQKDYQLTAQSVYMELTLRKKFDKSKANQDEFLKVVDDSWETYTSIFLYDSKKVKYPAMLIWEFLQNFSYQFSMYHFRLSTLTPEKIRPEWFNYEKTIEILKELEENIPENPDKKAAPTSLEYFGYYSVVIRATIETYLGNFKQALSILSRIGSNHLIFYSKAFGSYLTLFLIPAYCYFQLGEYDKTARLCEIIVLFYQKYKKYLPKIADRHLSRLHEKLVGLLSITYIFLEEKPKSSIMEIFKNTMIKTKENRYKEKISDKYNKMRQHDSNTFMKLFNYSSLPLIGQKVNVDERQKQIQNRFEGLKEITLNTLIQNYKEIPITKLARYLNCSTEEALKQIESYSDIERGTSPWETTIVFPLLKQKRKATLAVNNNSSHDVLYIQMESGEDGKRDWEQYREEIKWLIQKVQLI